MHRSLFLRWNCNCFISVILVLIPFISVALASFGDNQHIFQKCVQTCEDNCFEIRHLQRILSPNYLVDSHPSSIIPTGFEKYVPSQQQLDEYSSLNPPHIPTASPQELQRILTIQHATQKLEELTAWQTLDLWLLRWDCPDQCRYECMHDIESKRAEQHLATEKYFGKWPFIRILGMQELGSTLFSIFNFFPFVYYFFRLGYLMPRGYWMYPAWYGYTISGMNTWIWSTAFHARDNIVTERLDYFCATLSILYLLNLTIIRLLRLPIKLWCLPIIPSITYFSWHCYTLHYIHFDYGWNMTMMVIFGSTYCLLWYIWALCNPQCASYRWKICVANSIILFMSTCEVFDFPPLFGLFDAHSIWHFSTPICTFLTFEFAIDDAFFVTKQQQQQQLSSSISLNSISHSDDSDPTLHEHVQNSNQAPDDGI